MKKEIVITTIALPVYQATMVRLLQSGKIDFKKDSLRDIAKKCGDKKSQPQIAKHHIHQLLKLGVIQFIRGEYVYLKDEK